MISLKRSSIYRLIDTKKQVRILYLDDQAFAWIDAEGIGEILVSSHVAHKADSLLCTGNYRIYEVEDEPKLVDQNHLELEAGRGIWQGYLLPTGLPDSVKTKSRIIPTKELITNGRASVQASGDEINDMSDTQIMRLGEQVGIDFLKVSLKEFRQGLSVELEHGSKDPETNVTNNDLFLTSKIAWAHLKEIPDYYTRLQKMETEAETQ
jgi:Protein of unknown function (DUF5661)